MGKTVRAIQNGLQNGLQNHRRFTYRDCNYCFQVSFSLSKLDSKLGILVSIFNTLKLLRNFLGQRSASGIDYTEVIDATLIEEEKLSANCP